ncbi:hypothetical protein B0A58_01020 [Flavobacterium branchiophilum NBRC 15030 = ATCC 35035]|uniref:Uncharacterized protein DUF1648 n=2 Tax=Flavobacterium branchiophilum TaxID=55197 RepID=A0A543G8I7_9FLAO|nr:DUF1648 domain-containing protein [Flavobacterium branchiophilum]OXA81937.1 hypothetical protein B0A58_01020 [Flavobacterium branchiophilum NBRC 15030 = ATCC 35035]TQM42284.1 uncharacterized protein DUF1648 [Flavobacterium branchiophilum]GEM54711.1 hypothetical protein FB1_09320 [Flavobacterium branchiophilum NBRC 15030 = ATCC 35035]
MKNQFKITSKLNPTEQMIEVLGFILLLAYCSTIYISYHKLPAKIPIHYNIKGEIDHYGSKNTIFILPFIAILLYILPLILNKKNKDKDLDTFENDVNIDKLVRFVKIIIIIIFFSIDYFTIESALGKSQGLGKWFLMIMCGILLIPIVYFGYKSYLKFK